jgi:hypothetical protein
MSEATDLLAAYIAAETAVLSFGSYQWGDRRMTRSGRDPQGARGVAAQGG